MTTWSKLTIQFTGDEHTAEGVLNAWRPFSLHCLIVYHLWRQTFIPPIFLKIRRIVPTHLLAVSWTQLFSTRHSLGNFKVTTTQPTGSVERWSCGGIWRATWRNANDATGSAEFTLLSAFFIQNVKGIAITFHGNAPVLRFNVKFVTTKEL